MTEQCFGERVKKGGPEFIGMVDLGKPEINKELKRCLTKTDPKKGQ